METCLSFCQQEVRGSAPITHPNQTVSLLGVKKSLRFHSGVWCHDLCMLVTWPQAGSPLKKGFLYACTSPPPQFLASHLGYRDAFVFCCMRLIQPFFKAITSANHCCFSNMMKMIQFIQTVAPSFHTELDFLISSWRLATFLVIITHHQVMFLLPTIDSLLFCIFSFWKVQKPFQICQMPSISHKTASCTPLQHVKKTKPWQTSRA